MRFFFLCAVLSLFQEMKMNGVWVCFMWWAGLGEVCLRVLVGRVHSPVRIMKRGVFTMEGVRSFYSSFVDLFFLVLSGCGD